MPLTAAKIYPKQFHATLGFGLRDFVAFLIDDHAITGPGWSIVEAFDSTVVSRQIPSTTTGTGALASFTGTFSWKDNTLTTDDWIVLETNIGGIEFQLYLEFATATSLQYILFPFEDFATGGAAVSPPTFPSRAVGSGTSVVTHSLANIDGGAWYSVVADEQMMALVIMRGGKFNISVGWVGSLSDPLPSDTRPFVIWDSPSSASLSISGTFTPFNRISPIDNNTVITNGLFAHFRVGGTGFPGGSSNIVLMDGTYWLDEQPLLPVMVVFNDTNNQHIAGYLRNSYAGHNRAAYRSVFGALEYIVFSDGDGTPCWCLPWDGVTDW